MHSRILRFTLLPLAILSLAANLAAQANPPPRPRVSDLKEEQRLIDKAYLGDADFQIKRARERLGAGNHRLAQQSGLWALEQIAYAKRRLERHATKIEEAGGTFFERASESAREELRKSYSAVRDNYHNIEERLEGLAEGLKKAGMPILSETLQNVRSSSGDDAIRAVNAGLRRAGESGQGDKVDSKDTIKDATAGHGTGGGGGGGGASGLTEQVNSQGVRFTQTADGVLVFPPGTLIRGAKLGPNGTLIFADGTSASIESIKAGPGNTIIMTDPATGRTSTINPTTGLPQSGAGSSQGGPGGSGSAFNGSLPSGVSVVDQNGRKITVGPDWRNGEQPGVSKDYIDMAGGNLDSETKVTRKLVATSGSVWTAQEIVGEKRNWNFTIRVGDEKKGAGTISFLLTVDGGGQTGFTIKSWEVLDASGARAAVTPVPGKPEATATFSKGGKYESFATGETDWGTPFRFKGPVIDAYP